MNKKKKDVTFEENYFEGYYHGIGDFSDSRDGELTNWFKSIFDYINRYYPITRGRGRKLIEFGCATGAAANLLANYGFQVTSTDVSRYAVTNAKKNYKDINFFVHDIQKLFSKDKNFDVAIALDVIEHLESPERAIKNIYKILKKGGIMLLTTPNDYKYVSNDPTHINVKRPASWKKIVKQAGFKDIKISQVTFIPYLYRFHWRLNYPMPFAINSPYFISPVFIIAKK